jgi:hypothetical protein
MSHQRWSDDIRQQARALYVADGPRLAAEVTQVPERTIRAWAASGNWRQEDPATDQAPDQQDSPVAPDVSLPEPEAKGEGLPVSGDPALELVRDLHLARRVFRQQADRFLAGMVTSAAYRDSSVPLGILEDKVNKRGLPGSRGGDFSWSANAAQARENIPLLRQWLAAIRERIGQEQGGG